MFNTIRSILPALLIGMILINLPGSVVFAQSETNNILTLEYPQSLESSYRLGKKITESSGIIYFDDGFWTFNDSGGKPELYKVRSRDGVLEKTVLIENATNVDWEDMTQDEDYIYVADAGNNRGSRQDLKIYKIRKKSVMVGEKNRVQAEIIAFSYSDQESYRDRNRNNNYDCESIVSFDNNLILFSKNWVDGKTRLYRISKKPGKYKISPISEFDANGLITAADYYPDQKQLVMLGYSNMIPFIYLFRGFSGSDFDAQAIYRINFPEMDGVQTEGICFMGPDKVAISTEKNEQHRQAVYIAEIRNLLANASSSEQE